MLYHLVSSDVLYAYSTCKLLANSLHAMEYRMAENFGGKIFWRIAENMSFGGIYFSYNDIHNKMATQTRWDFNRAVS